MSGTARIAVPVAEQSVARAVASAKEAQSVADIIEFRLDYLPAADWSDLPEQLGRLAAAVDKQIIFTLRPEEEGGKAAADVATRRRFWLEAISSLENTHGRRDRFYYDLEVALVELLAGEGQELPWPRVIASHHRLDSTPNDLGDIYDRLKATPAGILKIATHANDISDSLSIFRVLETAQREGRRLIAIAMGASGIITRVLGPAYGGFLTFGSLGKGSETAPGQVSAADLRDVYRLDHLSVESCVVGVIGNPVGHSLSPLIHNSWFKLLGLDSVYLPFEVRNLSEFVTLFVKPASRRLSWTLRGLSVTIPHKIGVIEHLDYVDPLAQAIGAVNTIVVEGDRLLGYNTDVVGLIKPLEKRISLKSAHAAIIGTGGAARAAAFALRERGANVTIVGRDDGKTRQLAEAVSGEARLLADLDSLVCDVVINATPMGMKGFPSEHPVPRECLRMKPLVYDLVYNPVETKLIRDAIEAGCETVSGIEMFLIQAAEQFRLWFGIEPPLDAVYRLVYTKPT